MLECALAHSSICGPPSANAVSHVSSSSDTPEWLYELYVFARSSATVVTFEHVHRFNSAGLEQVTSSHRMPLVAVCTSHWPRVDFCCLCSRYTAVLNDSTQSAVRTGLSLHWPMSTSKLPNPQVVETNGQFSCRFTVLALTFMGKDFPSETVGCEPLARCVLRPMAGRNASSPRSTRSRQ